ncbi:cell division protein FtsZ [uncultured Metabacillus sp.]|uniref:cell division protein FtsZ n=1 Tax=uncultured Metabacillus sp. TaxID=2860135 RepID=UPI00261E1D6F|nr:cell division protein FtsZ [uncultured Metabacillus sp.]
MYLGVIGIGAAGGNIADEAALRGIPSLAINFSKQDLDSLLHVEDKLHFVGSEGIGKVRDNAIMLMKNNWELAVNFIKTKMSTPSLEIILVCFSTAGGSGGGSSPILLEILQSEFPEKTFVAVPILPANNEAIINQINCLETMNELSTQNISVFPIDNEKVRTIHNQYSKNKLYNYANHEFIEVLAQIITYTNKFSKFGVLDQKDLLQIFLQKGIGIMSRINLSDMPNSKQLNEYIQRSWKKSVFAPIDYKQVIKAGIIFDGTEHLLENINFDELFNVFANGMPIDLFEGTYMESDGTVISILSGLPWINERLAQVEEIINKGKVDLEISNNTFTPKTNYRNLKSTSVQKQNKGGSALDILKKYQR